MGNVPSGNMPSGVFTMNLLIIKENVGAVCLEELGFSESTQKNRLINPNIPGPKRPDHTLVGGCRSGCHQGGSDRRVSRG